MSFFEDEDDDEHYYEAEDDFARTVLSNAEKLNKHPLEHLAEQQAKAFETMGKFIEQDPHVSKSERIAIKADVEEATEAMHRACKVIPARVIEE